MAALLTTCRQKFIEQELAKRLGKDLDSRENEDPETRRKRQEAEMYQIPDEYKVGCAGDHTSQERGRGERRGEGGVVESGRDGERE
jgi:hypothetical protein